MATAAPTRAEVDRPDRIRLTNKRNAFFYISLAKQMLAKGDVPEVELTGLGLAINSVVTCSEILKTSEFCRITRIRSSCVEADKVSIPRIQVFIAKAPRFDELFAAETASKAARDASAAAQ